MQFEKVLETFIEFFDRNEIRYALVDGLAVHAWGRVRSTKDADFLVNRDNQDRVVTFAESLGYETLHVSSGFSNHSHADPEWGRVDFLYVDAHTAEQIFGQASTMAFKGIQAIVAAPEHLAMMKPWR